MSSRSQSEAYRDKDEFKKLLVGILESGAETEAKRAAIYFLLRPFSVSRNMQEKGMDQHHTVSVASIRDKILKGGNLDSLLDEIVLTVSIPSEEHAYFHLKKTKIS